MRPEIIPFYMDGREIKSLSRYRDALELEEIADRVTDEKTQASLRDVVEAACSDAVEPLRTDRKKKRAWLEEHKAELEEIRGLPGPQTPGFPDDVAWLAYCDGVAHELAYVTEPEILELLDDAEEDEEDNDEDDNEDEDDGEDDGEDGDDEDATP